MASVLCPECMEVVCICNVPIPEPQKMNPLTSLAYKDDIVRIEERIRNQDSVITRHREEELQAEIQYNKSLEIVLDRTTTLLILTIIATVLSLIALVLALYGVLS